MLLLLVVDVLDVNVAVVVVDELLDELVVKDDVEVVLSVALVEKVDVVVVVVGVLVVLKLLVTDIVSVDVLVDRVVLVV